LTILLQQSYVEAVFEENMLGLFNLDEVNSKMLITYFTDALFVAFPLILTATLAAAGVAIGKEVTNSAQSGGASANTAGGSGARGGKIGNKAGKGAAKGTGKLATKGKKT
jgi:hypothetical protein